MPAYLKRTLNQFVVMSPSEVVGELALANAAAPTRFQLAPEAIDAWRLQLGPLQAGIRSTIGEHPDLAKSTILLEYPIPIVGKRIDAVLLIRGLIVVVETKTGFAPSSAVRQVEDYALNLACFHEACIHRTIVPLVVSDARASGHGSGTAFDDLIEVTRLAASNDVAAVLETILAEELPRSGKAIEPDVFDTARFKPIPRIIDAAVSLYHDMDVFEIGHACAGEESLKQTTDALIRYVEEARTKREKLIWFVTGVPGAGKTLVGLNAVHQPQIR
jgi:hypothetical protein